MMRAALPCLLLATALAGACGGSPPAPRPGGEGTEGPERVATLTDVTAAAGITFVHHNAATPRRYLPETMGAGVAVFDYDGDGWPDLYFVNGAPVDAGGSGGAAPPGALYRNRGDGTFDDVTRAAGLDAPFLGMGAATGDVEDDGDLDLFVTGVGGDRLFVNRGDGTFEEDAARRGLNHRGFGSSAAFLDADGDGLLDLFAGRYVEWSPEEDLRCSPDGEHSSYCTPEAYPGQSNRFYRNLGGGTFADVTRAAGVLRPEGKTLGVVPLDHDRDGRPDLAVANDTARNFLFRNRGDGTFEEVGVEAGIAFSPSGSTRGGMGIDAGDLSGDGRADVVVGNFSQEMSAVYRSAGEGLYRDDAAQLGVGLPSLMTLAFGTLLVDLDGDGFLDLVLVNGHIEPDIARFQPHQSHAQPPALFRNLGPGAGFEPLADPGDLARPLVGRGLAAGDLDGDGDPDLAVTQNGGPARLFRNDRRPTSWLRLRLVGTRSNHTGYGTEVTAAAAGMEFVRTLVSGRSYLSASEPVLTLGLGDAAAVERLEVRWPSGTRQVLLDLPVDRQLVLIEPPG